MQAQGSLLTNRKGAPYRRYSLWVLVTVALGLLVGCAELFEGSRSELVLNFSFEEDKQQWTDGVSGYPAEVSKDRFELIFDHRSLPKDVEETGKALFYRGDNLSGNLFMFVKRKLTGLQPSTTYSLRYTLKLASNIPTGCAGGSAAAGESSFLKVGALTQEPKTVMQDGWYRLNVDKGNQQSEPQGGHIQMIGTIDNGTHQCSQTPYRMITRHSQNDPVAATTDKNGHLWLLLGVDSGFEGRTALYYNTIEVRISPE